jgi:hypothetical protein
MSERETDRISGELRATAPSAPEELRRTVLELAARAERAEPRRRPLGRGRWFAARRTLALGAAAFVVLTAGATVIPRLTDGESENPNVAARAPGGQADQRQPRSGGATDTLEAYAPPQIPGERLSRATLPPARRLQNYHASIRLRVDDADALSAKAQQAMRDARRMGGFVSSVDFATEDEGGNATLVLRVPVTRIQEAVARFSELGTILAQQVRIDDLQPQADRLAATISRLRKRIGALETKQRRVGLTPAEQFQLDSARQQLRTSTQRRAALVRQATYATVSLELTTEKSAEKEQPGAFRTFWDDASKILTTEVIWLLYALVVAGPFALLAILALLAERTRRRRANDALLAHH